MRERIEQFLKNSATLVATSVGEPRIDIEVEFWVDNVCAVAFNR